MIDIALLENMFRDELRPLELAGYTLNAGYNNIRYEKGDLCIGFDYSLYTTVHVYGLRAYKRFPAVENMIGDIVTPEFRSLYTIHKRFDGADYQELINELPARDNTWFSIGSPEAMTIFGTLVKAFYIREAAPFFEQYQTLDAVIATLEKMPWAEEQQLLTSYSNTSSLRRLIILRLAGNPAYEAFLAIYKASLAENALAGVTPDTTMYEELLKAEEILNNLKI
jgi:hypothetical protein